MARRVPCAFNPSTSHSTEEPPQPIRCQAHLIRVAYAYNFQDLFSKALQNVWTNARSLNPPPTPPKKFMETGEPVLDQKDQPAEAGRAPGNNPISMISWVFNMETPKYPNGHSVVAIAMTSPTGSVPLALLKIASYTSLRGMLTNVACPGSTSRPTLAPVLVLLKGL